MSNKKLEETFNLPEIKEKSNEIKKGSKEEQAKSIMSQEDIIDHDEKMDEYAESAFTYAKEVFELGMDVEPKYSADMFTAVSNLMKVAVESKNAKIDKKLRLYELELKKQKLDYETQKNGTPLPNQEGYIQGNRKDILDDED